MAKLKSLILSALLACSMPAFANEEAQWLVDHSKTDPKGLSQNNALTNTEQYKQGEKKLSELKNIYQEGVEDGKAGGDRIEAQLKSRASQTRALKDADALVQSKKQIKMDHNHPLITESERSLSKVQLSDKNAFGVVAGRAAAPQKIMLQPVIKTCREAAIGERRFCCAKYIAFPGSPKLVTAKVGDKQGSASTISINLRTGKISGANDPESIVENPLGAYANKASAEPILQSIDDWKPYAKGSTQYSIKQYPNRGNDFTVIIYIADPSAKIVMHWNQMSSGNGDWFHAGNATWNQNRSVKATFKVPMAASLRWSLGDCARLQEQTRSGFCYFSTSEKQGVNETRIISGIPDPISKLYWAEKRIYICGGGSEKNECETLRQQGCLQTKSECAIKKNGVCIEWEHTYECLQPKALHSSGLQLNGETIRLGFDVAEPKNEVFPGADFADATAKLAIFDELKGSNMFGNKENPYIFAGEGKSCPVYFGGSVKDCCNFRGVLKNLFGGCGAYKKLAGEVLNAKVCHLVERKRCVKKEKFTKICLKKETTYCCYKNKLARILQEIAHHQLGIGWGSGASPKCGPISAEQLSRINFDTPFARSRLAEFIQEQAAKTDKLAARVQEKFKQAGNIRKRGEALQQKMAKKLSHLKKIKPQVRADHQNRSRGGSNDKL